MANPSFDATSLEELAPRAGGHSALPPSERALLQWNARSTLERLSLSAARGDIGPEFPAVSLSVRREVPEVGHSYSIHTLPFDEVLQVVEEEPDRGLYLLRSTNASAAQALSGFKVTFEPLRRSAQLARLREFRLDTREAAHGDIERWFRDQLPGRRGMRSAGAISTGVVVSMSQAEVARLRAEVPNVMVLRNRALTLIPPTLSSGPASSPPPDAAWHLEAIGMAAARRDGKAYSGEGVRVAVLDTGVQGDHPELAGRVVDAWKIRDNPATTDFSSLEPDPAHQDTDGHGTHVAGLIAGRAMGVATAAEIASILLMPWRKATTFDFVRCLDWVAEHPEVALVNLSAGITPFCADMIPFVADIIRTGALPFMAVGNEGPNNTRSPGNYIDGASIGAVDPPGKMVSSFSGSGQQVWDQTIYTVPDLVAPGAGIWSSIPVSQYIAMDGTSMATPIACGVAACIIESEGGALSPLDLMDKLRRSCGKLAGEPDIRQGAGIIRVPVRV